MVVRALSIFDVNPKAQEAFEQALERGELNYPDPDQGQPSPLVIRYGDEDHAYINVNFEHGEAVIRDGADPTGTAHKFPEDQWRTYTGQESRDEAMEQVAKENADRGIGLDGLKTGEQADRVVDPADTRRDRR